MPVFAPHLTSGSKKQSGLSSMICSLIKKLGDLTADLCPGLRLQPVLVFGKYPQGSLPGLVSATQATAV